MRFNMGSVPDSPGWLGACSNPPVTVVFRRSRLAAVAQQAANPNYSAWQAVEQEFCSIRVFYDAIEFVLPVMVKDVPCRILFFNPL
jgi:hypothetical protein